MELTKFENRVMSPNYPRKSKWFYLYTGIAFVVMGIGVGVYGFAQRIPQTASVWENELVLVRKIIPQTEGERLLAKAAEGYLESAKTAWVQYEEGTTQSTAMFFVLTGIFLIGTYNREFRYQELIKKIKAPNQAL